MSDDADGATFTGLFAASQFGGEASLAQRIAKDRRSGKTTKQRAAMGREKTANLNIRCTPAFLAACKKHAAARGVSMSDLLYSLVADHCGIDEQG